MSTDYGDHGCTDEFSGTSAAAPMVSGAIALALQAKYVQHHQINFRSICYHLNTKLNADNFREQYFMVYFNMHFSLTSVAKS